MRIAVEQPRRVATRPLQDVRQRTFQRATVSLPQSIRRRTRREAACTWSAGTPAPVLSTVAAGQTRVSARRIGAHSAAVSSNARSTSRSSLVSSGSDPPFAPAPACCAGSG